MLNRVFLIGTVEELLLPAVPARAGDVPLFTLAVVERARAPAAGGAGPEVQRFSITVRQRSLAERCGNQVHQRDLVFVEGRLLPQPEREGPAPIPILAGDVLVLWEAGVPALVESRQAGAAHALVFARPSAEPLLASLEAMPPVLGGHLLPFVGFPITPLWVELDPPQQQGRASPFACALVSSQDAQGVHCRLFSETGQLAALVIAADGHWKLSMPPRCGPQEPCPLAPSASACGRVEWTRESAARRAGTCACGRAALREAQFLFLLGHALAAHGLEREEFTGRPPLAQRWAKARADLPWGQIPQRYERVALITRGPVLAARKEHASPRGAGVVPGATPAEKQGQRTFSSYHRILIPGEGKPWLSFQVVYVPGNRQEGGRHTNNISENETLRERERKG